jgi:alkylation response protein AidB-like acyl-CoA dehydrogenase
VSELSEPSAAVRPLLDRAAKLVDELAVPLEPKFLAGGFPAVEAELGEAREEARRRGLWAPQLPREWRGLGLGLVELAHLSEVLGRSPLGHFLVNLQAPDAGNLELLLEFANPEQQEAYLDPLSRGAVRSCFAMTEPDFPGSNPVWMGTRARREGGSWVLDGRKWFTSAADGAAFAVVMAVTDPEAEPHRRASLFLVPTDTQGFRRVRNIPVMGEAGGGWASHSEITLSGCRVPEGALLGGQGDGFAIAQARLGPGRIHHCMRWIGVCERVFDLMCERAATRELAPGRALGEQQAVQAWIAESRAEIDAARLLVLDTAHRMEVSGPRATRERISLIKFYAAGVLSRVLDRAVQVHGALGMTDDTPLAWFYRHERGARLYDGPDEVHKQAVARRILRRYGLGRARDDG